ncbi:MAG: VC0807 family protein [Opitutales bacterium]
MPAPTEPSPGGARASRPTQTQPAPTKQENPWLSLGFNLLLPILLFKNADDWFGVSPAYALILALAFPIGYFIYDWFARHKRNWISVLGVVSLLLTGGIGLLKLPTEWVPIKEAAVPLIIALVLLVSLALKRPLVRPLVMNRELMNVDRVYAILDEKNARPQLNHLLTHATLWLVASSAVSAIINYVVADSIVTADSGTAEFNEQMGDQTLATALIVFIPSTLVFGYVLWRLASGLKALTGLPYEAIFPKLMEAEKAPTKETDQS